MLECCTYAQITYCTVMKNDWKNHFHEHQEIKTNKQTNNRKHVLSLFWLVQALQPFFTYQDFHIIKSHKTYISQGVKNIESSLWLKLSIDLKLSCYCICNGADDLGHSTDNSCAWSLALISAFQAVQPYFWSYNIKLAQQLHFNCLKTVHSSTLLEEF